jgi:hypothetical protein
MKKLLMAEEWQKYSDQVMPASGLFPERQRRDMKRAFYAGVIGDEMGQILGMLERGERLSLAPYLRAQLATSELQ